MIESAISYIGCRLIGPIIELYKILEKMEFSGQSIPQQVSTDENGYSISILLLCAVFVESTINRMRYFENSTKGKENLCSLEEVMKSKESNLDFFKKCFSDKSVVAKIEEIYILRDLLIHNHIWKAE